MEAVGVRVEGVSKRYSHKVKGEVYAARDVTLDVRPGEFVTMLGPSGCGKTTTLRMIAGFEAPDAGRVVIGGRDVTHDLANQRNIGFVFQNYALFPHLSVRGNLLYGPRVRREEAARAGRAMEAAAATLGLGQLLDRPHPSSMERCSVRTDER